MIEVGETIGNYRITAKLGEGGMGIVFLAEHPVIGRKVALKAIHPELSRNPDVVSRFVTEAKSVNQIGNEHIVDVHDFGNTTAGDFYFIMEFLQGESLAERLTRVGPLDPQRALNIASQVADALGASHDRGIIHRDLKPENIFLITRGQTPDFVKVLDFGLAKLTQGKDKVSHKTITGSVMGTPYYMAPEQCEGRQEIDHRADVYSLGVILFEMLTGRVPFGGEGYGEIIVKHLTQPPPSPREINLAVSPAIETVTLKALAKTRETRFQTMVALRTALLDPEKFIATESANDDAAANAKPNDDDGMATRATLVSSEVAKQISGYELSGGKRSPSGERLGARKGPLPSTFGRHGTGEILDKNSDKNFDEDFAPARSRRGLVVAALLVAAAAGVFGLFSYSSMRGSSEPAAEPTAAVAGPTTPPPPTSVRIAFSSDPAGADVVVKETGQHLGATPFERDIDYSTKPVTFVFAKLNFQSKERSVVPDRSSNLDTSLAPVPGVGGTESAVVSPDGTGGARGAVKASKPSRSRRSAPRPLPADDNGVLPPQL
jgi:serine/threonine protein kinase